MNYSVEQEALDKFSMNFYIGNSFRVDEAFFLVKNHWDVSDPEQSSFGQL